VKLKDNYYSDADLQKLLVIDQSKFDATRPGIQLITYQVTDPSGNKSLKAQRYVVVNEVTGIEELNANSELSVYPNPSKGMFKVTHRSGKRLTSVEVMDVMGRKVYQNTQSDTQVDVNLTEMNKGLYLIMMKDESGQEYTAKLIVE
jgi:hypothetical protein